MIAVVFHAMAPDNLALLEQEFTADLEDIAALDHIALADGDFVLAVERGRGHGVGGLLLLHRIQLRDIVVQSRLPLAALRGLHLRLVQLRLPRFDAFADSGQLIGCPGDGRDVFHVLRAFHSDVNGEDHSEAFEEGARGLGVDGERAACFQLVEGDQLRVAAADDDDARGRRDRKVFLHRDVVADCFEVGLTGAAVEVTDEDDELSRVLGCRLVVEAAEGHGAAVCGVYGDVVGGCEGRAVGALVGDVLVLVGGVVAEACEPFVWINHIDAVLCAIGAMGLSSFHCG